MMVSGLFVLTAIFVAAANANFGAGPARYAVDLNAPYNFPGKWIDVTDPVVGQLLQNPTSTGETVGFTIDLWLAHPNFGSAQDQAYKSIISYGGSGRNTRNYDLGFELLAWPSEWTCVKYTDTDQLDHMEREACAWESPLVFFTGCTHNPGDPAGYGFHAVSRPGHGFKVANLWYHVAVVVRNPPTSCTDDAPEDCPHIDDNRGEVFLYIDGVEVQQMAQLEQGDENYCAEDVYANTWNFFNHPADDPKYGDCGCERMVRPDEDTLLQFGFLDNEDVHLRDTKWSDHKFWNGSLDQIRLWGCDLSQETIQEHMNFIVNDHAECLLKVINFDDVWESMVWNKGYDSHEIEVDEHAPCVDPTVQYHQECLGWPAIINKKGHVVPTCDGADAVPLLFEPAILSGARIYEHPFTLHERTCERIVLICSTVPPSPLKPLFPGGPAPTPVFDPYISGVHACGFVISEEQGAINERLHVTVSFPPSFRGDAFQYGVPFFEHTIDVCNNAPVGNQSNESPIIAETYRRMIDNHVIDYDPYNPPFGQHFDEPVPAGYHVEFERMPYTIYYQTIDYNDDYRGAEQGMSTYSYIIDYCASGVFDSCGVCDGDDATCTCHDYLEFSYQRLDYVLFMWTSNEIINYRVPEILLLLNQTLDLVQQWRETQLQWGSYDAPGRYAAGEHRPLFSFYRSCLLAEHSGAGIASGATGGVHPIASRFWTPYNRNNTQVDRSLYNLPYAAQFAATQHGGALKYANQLEGMGHVDNFDDDILPVNRKFGPALLPTSPVGGHGPYLKFGDGTQTPMYSVAQSWHDPAPYMQGYPFFEREEHFQHSLNMYGDRPIDDIRDPLERVACTVGFESVVRHVASLHRVAATLQDYLELLCQLDRTVEEFCAKQGPESIYQCGTLPQFRHVQNTGSLGAQLGMVNNYAPQYSVTPHGDENAWAQAMLSIPTQHPDFSDSYIYPSSMASTDYFDKYGDYDYMNGDVTMKKKRDVSSSSSGAAAAADSDVDAAAGDSKRQKRDPVTGVAYGPSIEVDGSSGREGSIWLQASKGTGNAPAQTMSPRAKSWAYATKSWFTGYHNAWWGSNRESWLEEYFNPYYLPLKRHLDENYNEIAGPQTYEFLHADRR